MNRVDLVGRLARDPDLSYTESGLARGRFIVAVKRPFQSQDGETADFIPVVVWRKQAELVAEHLEKGSLVSVSGRLQSRKVKANGQTKVFFEVVADHVEFLSWRKRSSSAPPPEQAPEDEEVPF